jgi:hypothetical protein
MVNSKHLQLYHRVHRMWYRPQGDMGISFLRHILELSSYGDSNVELTKFTTQQKRSKWEFEQERERIISFEKEKTKIVCNVTCSQAINISLNIFKRNFKLWIEWVLVCQCWITETERKNSWMSCHGIRVLARLSTTNWSGSVVWSVFFTWGA